MAYRRSYGRSGGSGRYGRPARRAAARRSSGRRSTGGGSRAAAGRDVRIVIEMAPGSAVSRPGINPAQSETAKPKKAKL